MGGGGFMKHASDTNRQDRAQKIARRNNYEKSHPENTILKNNSTKLDFSHLTSEQIDTERKRIKENFQKQTRKNNVIYILAFTIVMVIIFGLYLLIF